MIAANSDVVAADTTREKHTYEEEEDVSSGSDCEFGVSNNEE